MCLYIKHVHRHEPSHGLTTRCRRRGRRGRRRDQARDVISARIHVLRIREVVPLLQRHLRTLCGCRTNHGTAERSRTSTDRSATTAANCSSHPAPSAVPTAAVPSCCRFACSAPPATCWSA